MKPVHAINELQQDTDALAVYGAPKGDELPQVAGVEDILMDVYSDILNMPREYAVGHFHHQFADDFEFDDHDGFERFVH